MIPYGCQWLGLDDVKEVVKVLRSDRLTQGPKIQQLEQALADFCGAKYALVASSGTAALHLAYRAAGLGHGDEVVVSPNTFVATANMLLVVGSRPIFCDIRPDTYNIDETKIEALISGKTKAIVPVHFAGHPCEMRKIKAIAVRHKLLIIEDACHALGARYQNSKIGDCQFSDMAVFSFHPVKSITTGEGGAILTNSAKFYRKLALLRSHGIEKDKNGFNRMIDLGYNYRLTDFQAALGASQLKKIDKFIVIRRQLVKTYNKFLGGCQQIILPVELKNVFSSWHIYVIRTKRAKDRLPLYNFLLKNGIGVNFHYPVVYRHPYYRKNVPGGNCPMAEEYEKTVITLPLHPLLTEKNIKFISGKIKEFFKQ